MIKVTKIDTSEVEEKISQLTSKIKDTPEKLKEGLDEWQSEHLLRARPVSETEGDGKTFRTHMKRRRRPTALERVSKRFLGRLRRRLTPRPVRMLRRFARVGKRPQLLITRARPIRQMRRLSRLARGKGRAPVIKPVRHSRRVVRRARQYTDLMEALVQSVEQIGKDNVKV